MRTSTVWILASILVLTAGCGGAGDGDAKPKAKKNPNAKEWDPSAGTAQVSGKVIFAGAPGRREELQMAADPKCAGLHSEPVLDDSVVVGGAGGLANVLVRVKGGFDDWNFPIPSSPAVLAQSGCVFEPHVLGVQAGQGISIVNKDGVTHNVRSMADMNPTFNFSQNPGTEDKRTFELGEVSVGIKCDIHGWMSAQIAVVEHPFFAVTAEDGKFSLAGLPPGEYEIEAWHEIYGTQSKKVTLGDRDAKEISFEFSGE